MPRDFFNISNYRLPLWLHTLVHYARMWACARRWSTSCKSLAKFQPFRWFFNGSSPAYCSSMALGKLKEIAAEQFYRSGKEVEVAATIARRAVIAYRG